MVHAHSITVEQLECWCGLPIIVPDDLARMWREQGNTIYCAHGHTCVPETGTVNRLKKDISRLQESLAREQQERKMAEAKAKRETAKRKRIEKRISVGICPHCNRNFKNLKNHFQSKHCGPKEAKRIAGEMKGRE